MDENHKNNGNNDDGWEEIVQKPKRKNRRAFHKEDLSEDPLGSISYIPPPQLPLDSDHDGQAQVQQQEQFMLLLIGIPGSGKSTLAKCLQKARPYKFVRINQDELGSRNHCENMTRQVLENGKCPIIDRCNFDSQQRKHFLDMIIPHNQNQKTVVVDCVIFDIGIEECVRRCQKRSNHPTIQPHQARSIVKLMADQLRLPLSHRASAASGHNNNNNNDNNNDNELARFRTVYTIRDSHSFQDVLIKLLNQ